VASGCTAGGNGLISASNTNFVPLVAASGSVAPPAIVGLLRTFGDSYTPGGVVVDSGDGGRPYLLYAAAGAATAFSVSTLDLGLSPYCPAGSVP